MKDLITLSSIQVQKMPSLFGLLPNVLIIGGDTLFLLVSFSVFEMVIFPAFSFDLVPNIKHCKMCRVEDKGHPVVSKPLRLIMENNTASWDAAGADVGRMKSGGWSAPLPLIPGGQAHTAVITFWASSLPSQSPLRCGYS